MWELPLFVHSRVDIWVQWNAEGAGLHFAWVYFLEGDGMWRFCFVGFGGFFCSVLEKT